LLYFLSVGFLTVGCRLLVLVVGGSCLLLVVLGVGCRVLTVDFRVSLMVVAVGCWLSGVISGFVCLLYVQAIAPIFIVSAQLCL
jgi:hypothetical protein